MLGKLIAITSLTLLAHIAIAETCPKVADIRQNTVSGWAAYDSDDGLPLSKTREAQLRKTINVFTLAEWKDNKNKPGSSIHCYYSDKTGSSLEAYFAKDNFIPNKSNTFWYEVSGFLHCAAGMEKCQFETHHLAKNQTTNTQPNKSLS